MRRAELPVRRVAFEYPDDLEPAWNPRFPEAACAANSVSLLMPYAEPYFARTVRRAVPRLDEPLRSQADAFVRQELGHHRQHRRFNDLLVARVPRLARVEQWMRRTYGWLDRTRSPAFSLAFAAGSEAIAFAMARWIDRHAGELFAGADPVVTTLFLWHLAEEVEHKSVAYDVWAELDGSHLRYAWATAVSLTILLWFTWLATLTMLMADKRLRHPVTHFRLVRWALSLAFEVLPSLAASALPGHHPDTLADPVFLPRWLSQHDPESGTMPPWDFGSGGTEHDRRG